MFGDYSMIEADSLNAYARRAWREIVGLHPEWTQFSSVLPNGDFEIAVRAPSRKAEYLVLFSAGGQDLWLRFAPARACYPAESVGELLKIARRLMADELAFVVVTSGGKWVSTTLAEPRAKPTAEADQLVEVISWSGEYDRVLVPGRRRRTRA